MEVGRAMVEGHTKRRILARTMRQALGQTRDASPRQLPTDHDHDGGPLARSANIRLINRRHEPLDRHLPYLRKERSKDQR